jgi:hypothetical protein
LNAVDQMALPGPRQFVQRTIDAIHEGKNLGLFFPSYPEIDHVSFITSAQSHLFFETVDSENFEGVDPVVVISGLFDDASTPCKSIYELAQRPSIGGRLVIVTVKSDTTARRWLKFLDDWTRVSSGMPAHTRGFVCVISVGCSFDWSPSLPLFQEKLDWNNGFVSSIDTQAYTHASIGTSISNQVERQVLCGVISSLAGTDLTIVDELAHQPATVVFRPSPALNRIARTRAWSGSRVPLCARENLYTGQVEAVDGLFRLNSVALAAAGRHQEIQHRVWKGQVATLFPLLEECRQVLLNDLKRFLRLPVTTAFGRIDDIYDLEFSHLADQLGKASNARLVGYRAKVHALKRIRNSLAHLEPIAGTDFDSLLIAELLGITS